MYTNFSGSRQYSTDSIECLQICTISYSCKLNPRAMSKSEWKILSNFVQWLGNQMPVSTLVPAMFCNSYLVKNHKIANDSATTKAREKISTYLES